EALQAAKQQSAAAEHEHNIFRAVYSTHEEYCQELKPVLERLSAAIAKEKGASAGEKFMVQAEEELLCGRSPTPYLMNSIGKYASRLDDQRYYQLLSAFRELNRPLNKSIHKALGAAVPESVELRQVLSDLADAKEYIKDSKDCEEFVKQSIQNVMGTISGNKEYSAALSEYKSAFQKVFIRYMPQDKDEKQHSWNGKKPQSKADKYAERFNNTYDKVLMLMRPHYTFVDCAVHLDEISYRHIIQDKELQQPLKKLLRRQLDECLGDEQSFSAIWVRRQLERCQDNPKEAAQILSYLYKTSEDMRKLVDNQIGVLYDRLKAVMAPSIAATFSDQYREELLHGQFLPIHNSINFYGRNLGENYYRVLSKKHKAVLHELNRDVVKGLWSAIDDPAHFETLRELQNKIKCATDKQIPDVAATDQVTINHDIRQLMVALLGEEKLYSYTESIAEAFQAAIANEDIDPNLALSLYERVRSDVFSMELPSVNYMVRSFATELDTHLAESFLKKQLKHDAVRQFRSELYCAVRQMHTKDLPCKERVQLLSMYIGDRKCYNEILEVLSPEEGESFHSKQENLYLTLFNDYRAAMDEPMDYKDFRKVVDTFFHGEDGNTFFFQEPIQSAAADMMMPLPTFFIIKSLLGGLARCIAGAAAGTHGTNERNKEHAFRTQKQFHNVRFQRPEQFTEY
ncbi:MAG: hypothetical protein RSF82_10065, partial [Angelakisella sp.]